MSKVYCLAARDNIWYSYEVDSGDVITEWIKNVYYTGNDYEFYVFSNQFQRQKKINEVCNGDVINERIKYV